MLAKGQITVSNIDDGKTPFLHQAYKMKDGRFLKHYPVYEASPVNGYKEGDLWHKTDGSQPGYFVANKSNTVLNLNDWTFYANELAYSDTDKFYPKFEGTYSDYNEVASDDQTKYTWKIIKADDGIGIKSVKEYYATSTSNVTPPSSWSETPKTTDTTNKYLWNYEVYTYSNGDVKETNKRVIGTHGTTGATGNGITSVTNRYLATTLATGVTTATSGWTTTVQKTDSVKKYLWNYEEILYTNGTKIPTTPVIIGTHGEKGDKGSTGVGIKDIQEFYLASPLGEGVTRSTDGWTSDVQAIDSDKKYLWNYEKINYDNNTNYLTAPVIIGTFGSQGIGVKGVTEYYLASPLSEGIRKDTNGWTTEMQPLTPENKYLWNKEIIHYTDDESALKDKTEVLSGQEIFTDKADADAVVHVGIDGKSYQHAGSGKNLLTNDPNYWEIGSVNGSVDSGVNYPSTETLRSPYIELKKGSYTLSTPNNIGSYSVIENWFHTYDNNKKGIGASGWSSELSRRVEIPEDGCFVRVLIRSNPRTQVSLSDVGSMFNIQLEEGLTATEYEPPVPTPDYPIEIDSLNNVDVVSNVGKENLLLDSQREWRGKNEYISPSYNLNTIFDRYELGQTYTISFDAKSDDPTKNSSLQFYSNPGSTPQNKYVFLTKTFTGLTKEYKRYSHTITPTYSSDTTITKSGMSFYGQYNTGNIPTIRNIKIELGTEATPYTPASGEVGSSELGINLYKTNILLSEPLRSVGDVKDRLFRDTDGLWKVERNVGAETLDRSTGLSMGHTSYDGSIATDRWVTPIRNFQLNTVNTATSHFRRVDRSEESSLWFSETVGHVANAEDQIHINFSNDTVGIVVSDSSATRTSKIKDWLQSELNNGTPVIIQYGLKNPSIEILDQDLQDKLNNLRSFQASNYVYTIINDKTNILPNYVSENLKPNLNATFKSKAWSGNNAGYPSVIGVYGDSAKMLYLSATAESMTFNADGTPNPSSQVITLTANLQNVSGNASFVTTAYNGATVVSNVALTGAGNTRTFNQAQFPASANRVQVRATLGNLVDTVTIVKLANGSNGQNAVVGLLTNESITLPANKDGLVTSFTGAKGIFDVYDGITKKTGSGVKYSVVPQSQSNITVSIDTTGAYSVTAMREEGTILNGFATLKAVYNGVTIEKQLSVSKSVTGATGATGATGPKGATGSQGPKGDVGTSVSSVTEYYLATPLSTGVTTSTSGWSTSIQTMTATNKYLWNYEKINFSDGSNQPTIPVIIGVYGDKGQTGSTGATGRSITSITEHYLATSASSGVTRSTSGWSTAMQPTTEANKYLWNYETVNWSSGTTPTYVEPIIIGVHGAKGDTGARGPQGIQGPAGSNGQSQWVHIRYSANSNGSSMTPTPQSNTAYIGMTTTTSSTAPTGYTSYTWSLFKGPQGSTGPQGIQGPKGANGQATYTWIRYADTPTSGMNQYPDGKKYIGLAFNKTTQTESSNYSDYKWSLMPQNIEIGGRNLLKGTKPEFTTYTATTSEYFKQFGSDTLLEVGQQYTFSWKFEYTSGKVPTISIGCGTSGNFLRDVYYGPGMKGVGAVTFTPTESHLSNGYEFFAWRYRTELQAANYKVGWLKLEKGNIATDWTPAPEDARTYKAWANSADGGADFTRVYPNENLIVLGNAQDNKGITWALGAEYTRPGAMLTDYIEVSALENITTSRATVQLALYNQNKEYLSSMTSSLLSFFIPSNGTAWTNKPSTLPTDTDPKYLRATYDGVQVSDTEAKVKLEVGSESTIYTASPQDSLSGSIPKYVGFSPIDSDVPNEYEWIMNPEYAQALADEALADKVDNDAEYENLKNMAQEVKDSYEKFVGENGEYKTEHNKLLERTTTVETDLGVYRQQINFVDTYMSAGNEGLIIGMKDSEGNPDTNAMQMLLSNKSLSFMDGGEVVAYFSGQSFHINRGAIVDSLQIGQHKISNLGNGHTVFQFTG